MSVLMTARTNQIKKTRLPFANQWHFSQYCTCESFDARGIICFWFVYNSSLTILSLFVALTKYQICSEVLKIEDY